MPRGTSVCQGPERERAARLRVALLAWYDRNRRQLPWRTEAGPPDPWAVLLSEFMLQQTTARVVAARFPDLYARFPSPRHLARASPDEVLHAWQGLGYYRRARHLHACARAVVERHGGRLPADERELARLPGIGPCTAAAVAAIAFGHPVVPVDGNVARVVCRFFAVRRPVRPSDSALRRLAQGFAAPERAGDLAQATIELGALICRPRRPQCPVCPLRPGCRAAAAGDATELPVRTPVGERRRRYAVAFLAVDAAGRVLLRRRNDGGLLGGMWELPTGPWRDRPPAAQEAARDAPFAAEWQALPDEIGHVFTHLDLRLILCRARAPADVPLPAGAGWYGPREIAGLALPALTRKLLRKGGYQLPPSPGRQASAR